MSEDVLALLRKYDERIVRKLESVVGSLAWAVNAIQDKMAEVERLQARVKELEAKP